MKKVTIAGVIILLISVSVIPSTAIVVIVNEFPAKLIIDGPIQPVPVPSPQLIFKKN